MRPWSVWRSLIHKKPESSSCDFLAVFRLRKRRLSSMSAMQRLSAIGGWPGPGSGASWNSHFSCDEGFSPLLTLLFLRSNPGSYMTSERWHQIEKLFHSALELPSEARSTFLSEKCLGDDSLRDEVESLLRAHERDGAFLDVPAYEVADGLLSEGWIGLSPGQQIG